MDSYNFVEETNSFSSFLETNKVDIDNNTIKITIQNHLQSLHSNIIIIENYYPLNQDPLDEYLWVQNPCLMDSRHKLSL